MHLEVIQNNGVTELVTPQIIEKLYNLASTSGRLDSTSNLQGRLELYATYEDYVTYLRAKYPNLIINTSTYYFRFKDNIFGNICATLYGDGIGVTTSELSSVVSISDNLKTLVGNASNLLYIDLRGFSGLDIIGDAGIFKNISSLKGIYLKDWKRTVVLNFCQNCGPVLSGGSKPTLEKFIIDGIYLNHTDGTTANGDKIFNGYPGNSCNFGTIAVRRIAPRRSWDSSSTYYYLIGDYLTRDISISNFYLGETNPERVKLKLAYGDNINKITNFYVPLGCALDYANSSTWSTRTGEFLEYDFETDPNHIFE